MNRYASPVIASATLIIGFAYFLHVGFGIPWIQLLHAPGWDAHWLAARAI